MTNEPVIPFKDTRELRQEVIDTCLVMRDKLGYFVSTWGNISVRLEQGLLVTPSRVPYDQIQPEDLVLVSWEGVRLLGERVPSSETELHRQLMLERPDFGALIHSHSAWASVCACAHRAIPVLADDMAEVIGGPVHCASHVPAGRHQALAASVRRAIGPDTTAVLMANHGVMVGARNLQEATAASVIVEKSAMILIHAEAIGGAKPIPEDLWREERHRYLHKYGRPEDLIGVITEAR
jgi:L-fuculose-phosphate aldolase